MKIPVFLDNNITTTILNWIGKKLSFIGLDLTNIYMETDSVVLVVFKEIVRYKDVLQTLRSLIIECSKSLFLFLECLVRAVGCR